MPKLMWPSLSVSGESEPLSVETEESEGCRDVNDRDLVDALIVKKQENQKLRAELADLRRNMQ